MRFIALVCAVWLTASIAGSAWAAPAVPEGSFASVAGDVFPGVTEAAPEFPANSFEAPGRVADSAASAASAATVVAPGWISIVPEPRPYQLLLGGIGAVFYMARRQWKR